ncbi:hypothetical protein ACFX2I_037618 [Malus domestica]
MLKITPTIIIDKRGFRGQRFLAWYRHIENVSKVKDILYVLKQSPPHVPPTKLASKEECQNYDRHYEDDLQAKCLILTSFSEELKKLHEHMDTSCAMVDSLHKMHDIETSNVRFSNVSNLLNAKTAKGTSVQKHGQKMEMIFQDLESLGTSIDGKMAQDFFLASLLDDFTKFIVNYKVNRFDHTFTEMIDMCCKFEQGFKKDNGSENAITRKRLHKKKARKSKGTCFHCGNDERWKKKYRVPIASLMTRTFEGTISVIKSAFTMSSNSWIFDSGTSQHICNSLQGPTGSRTLRNEEMIVRVGNGTKISAKAIDTYMLKLPSGEWTPPGTPQLNGVSERRNRTLMNMVRTMMSSADLPVTFWGYALYTAAYLLNRVPSKETMGYEFYHPDDQKVFVARTAKFLEDKFVLKGTISGTMEINEINDEPQTSTRQVDNPVPEPLAPRRSERVSKPPKRYGLDNDFGEFHLLGDNDTKEDPRDYTEAMSDIDSKRWQEAMKSEMDSMYQNQVWTLIDPLEGIVPVGNKWVFKRKIGVDGNVETYKARLVAKGYRQREGIDYEETFSHVAMIKSIWILLAIAAYHDYEIWQMDVKTAFLNGYLEEELYMTQPEGFVSKFEKTKVCKLQRSIYGLKQASRSWNIHFDTEIKSFGFTQNEDDNCVYQKVIGDAVVFLVLYVDDIVLFGNDTAVLSSVKVWLSKTFHMKDLGDASYVLGIKLYRDRSRKLIGLSQSMYIDKVLSRFQMEQSKNGLLPVRHGIHLSKSMGPKTPEEIRKMSAIPYASAIGSLMYAMICTRPDIAYVVSITSRYQSNPGSKHWAAVKTLLKYLRRTKDMFLVYIGAIEFWKSKKQDVIVDSTTEAEYVAAAEAGKEAFWMKKFITELGVVPTITSPVTLYCDNSGAIAQAKEPRAHKKNKHFDRRFNIIRRYAAEGKVNILKVASADNVADPLTNPMSQIQLDRHMEKMGIRYMGRWL